MGRKFLEQRRFFEELLKNEINGETRSIGCSSCFKSVPLDETIFIPMEEVYPLFEKGLEPKVYLREQTCTLYVLCGSNLCLKKLPILSMDDLEESLAKNLEIFPCDYCLKYYQNVHRCASCKCKSYCSSTCQKEDWKTSHYRLCSLYQRSGCPKKQNTVQRTKERLKFVAQILQLSTDMRNRLKMYIDVL